MHRRQVFRFTVIALIVALVVSVQRDTFLRRSLLPKPKPRSEASLEETPKLAVRMYDVDHLLSGASAANRPQAAAQIEARFSEYLQSKKLPPVIKPVRQTLVVVAKPEDHAWLSVAVEQTRTLVPGQLGPLCAATPGLSADFGLYNPNPINDDGPPLAALGGKLKQLELPQTTRDDALQRLARAAGVTIRLATDTLSALPQQKIGPVSFNGLTAEEALVAICRSAGAKAPLRYDVIGGVVYVMTQEQMSRRMYTCVYDVRDVTAAAWMRYWLTAQHIDSTVVGDGGASVVDSLGTAFLTDFISPGSWTPDLGRVAMLRGRLVVTQTRENHRKIRAAFAEVRRLKTPVGVAR